MLPEKRPLADARILAVSFGPVPWTTEDSE